MQRPKQGLNIRRRKYNTSNDAYNAMMRSIEATRSMVDVRGGNIIQDEEQTNGWVLVYEQNRRATHLILVDESTYHRLKSEAEKQRVPMKKLVANCLN